LALALSASLALSAGLALPGAAQKALPGAAQEALPIQISDAAPLRSNRLEGGVGLTADAQEVAQQLDLYGQIARIDGLKKRLASQGSATTNLDAISARQDLFEARQQITRAIVGANLEVDYVLSATAGERNQYQQIIGKLQDRENKGIFINTVVAQTVNGVMWSMSGIFSMIAIDHAQASNPDGICSIAAGAIPSLMALYTLYQMRGPKSRMPDHPNMIAPLLSGQSTPDGYYPEHVLKFLNTVAPGKSDRKTRREELIKGWVESKYINGDGAVPSDKKAQAMSGTIEQRRKLSIALLQDRLSMINDIETEVVKMKRGLLELMPLLD